MLEDETELDSLHKNGFANGENGNGNSVANGEKPKLIEEGAVFCFLPKSAYLTRIVDLLRSQVSMAPLLLE